MNNASATSVVQTLEELPALVDNLLLLLSDKEKDVIKKRFNLDNKRKSTLEEIGHEFSVTRERVRQIEKNALAKMKRNVFNTSLKGLHEFVSDQVHGQGGFLKEDSLVDALFALMPDKNAVDNNRLHLSLVLHDGIECVGNTINFHPYLRERNVPDYSLHHASNQLINQLHKYGNVKDLPKVEADLKGVFEDIEFDTVRIKSLIDIDKRITLLEEGMVGLLEWRHVNPRTLRDKIMYVFRNEKRPLHFAEIAQMIEVESFDKRTINKQAVHNELIRHDQFVLIGRGIYALEDWGYERGTVAQVIEKVLEEKGEMDQDEIIDVVLKQRQVKKITIILALKNGEKFVRVGRKRYALK